MISSLHFAESKSGPKRGWSCPKIELPVCIGKWGASWPVAGGGVQTQEGIALAPKMPQPPWNQFPLGTLLPPLLTTFWAYSTDVSESADNTRGERDGAATVVGVGGGVSVPELGDRRGLGHLST